MKCIEGECIELVMNAIHELIPGKIAGKIAIELGRCTQKSQEKENSGSGVSSVSHICPVVDLETRGSLGCYMRGEEVIYEVMCPVGEQDVEDADIQKAEKFVITDEDIIRCQRLNKPEWWVYAATKRKRMQAQEAAGRDMTEELT